MKTDRQKILVIDDDVNVCRLCEETFSECGYEVNYAANPDDVIKIVGNEEIDLVITNSEISKLNGSEFLNELRSLSPDIAVIVMSALEATDGNLNDECAGGYSYLSKPVHLHAMKEVVKNVLEKEHLLKEISRLKTFINLFRVTEKISRTGEVSQLIKTMVSAVLAQTSSARAAVFYPDEETKQLYVHYTVGFEDQPIDAGRLERVHKIISELVQNNSTTFTEQLNERNKENSLLSDSFLSEEVLAIPLQNKGKTLGVLGVFKNSESDHFSEADRDIATFLTSQASIAIDNAELLLDLEILFLESMKSLAKILDERDNYTHGHSRRVSRISVGLGKEIGFDDKELDNLSYAGILHDIGKIGIPDNILLKPGPLTNDEYEVIKTHPEKGYHILKPIKKLSEVCEVVYAHHEWYNGNGYPRSLIKDDIPFAASIISVADAYDSITSDRVYRRRRSHRDAVEILKACSGTQFHPDVVDVFLSLDEAKLEN